CSPANHVIPSASRGIPRCNLKDPASGSFDFAQDDRPLAHVYLISWPLHRSTPQPANSANVLRRTVTQKSRAHWIARLLHSKDIGAPRSPRVPRSCSAPLRFWKKIASSSHALSPAKWENFFGDQLRKLRNARVVA